VVEESVRAEYRWNNADRGRDLAYSKLSEILAENEYGSPW